MKCPETELFCDMSNRPRRRIHFLGSIATYRIERDIVVSAKDETRFVLIPPLSTRWRVLS